VSVASDIQDVGRRRFLNWVLGTSAGAFFFSILYPVARYMSPPRIPESSAAEVEAGPVNAPDLLDKGFKIVRFGAEPVIVVRVSDTEFRAFSATCTYLDCIVEYRKEKQVMWCNCHNGQYDLSGKNVAGPPPRPLTVYQVHVVAKGAGQPDMLVVRRA
jgi:cytochrome b6-f complex iron-sulfur subunit